MKTKTIGQEVDEKVKTYLQLYKDLKADDNEQISAKARSLALHDIYVMKIVARMVLEQLEPQIDELEKQEVAE